MDSKLMLLLAALLPAALAVLLELVRQKTAFGRLKRPVQQLVFGVLFGGLAILGTEWGIPMNGAQMNCRDGAVLTAGLMFGAPAGLLAGVIGGAERWFAASWGVGLFTRTACTLSTVLAGVYAAALRKLMFEEKRPGWLMSLAIGVVMEIVHMSLAFLTNLSDTEQAMAVVRACTVPMTVANGGAVMLASMALTLLEGSSLRFSQEREHISQTVQRWMLVAVLLAFAVTSFMVYRTQDTIALEQADSLLELALEDVSDDILDASDRNLLRLAKLAAEDLKTESPETAAERRGLAEVSVMDSRGIITASTEARFIGYDMASGAQSGEFLCLLNGTEEYVQAVGPISFDETTLRKYAGVRTESGFVQVGYDVDGIQKDIGEQVAGIAKNRHVGRTGFLLVLDEQNEPVSAPEWFLTAEPLTEEQRKAVGDPEADTLGRITLQSGGYFFRWRTMEGFRLVTMLPEEEALQVRNVALYVNTFLEIMVFAALFLLIYLLIKRVVVDQMKVVNHSLARISRGDLSTPVNVRTNEEFALLSDDINTTVDTLRGLIDDAAARLRQELEFARDIQSSVLPGSFPAFPERKEFDIFALMDPAKEVGGDFYDFYLTQNDTLHFLVADVSGKGVPAAMFMMRAKTVLKSLTEAEVPVEEVFTRGNTALCEGNDAEMFVTAWQGGLELESGKIRFANAGHNPPLVRRAGGSFEYFKSRPGFVLAGIEGMRYQLQELQMQKGDILFLYTDGVTEAQNPAGELYGEERLRNALNRAEYADMRSLCEYLRLDVQAFSDHADQFDDITMLALQYFG